MNQKFLKCYRGPDAARLHDATIDGTLGQHGTGLRTWTSPWTATRSSRRPQALTVLATTHTPASSTPSRTRTEDVVARAASRAGISPVFDLRSLLWRHTHPQHPQGPALPVLPPLNPPKDWQVSSEGAEMIVNIGPDGSDTRSCASPQEVAEA